MQRITNLMMVLLRSEMTGAELDKTLFADLTDEEWTRLYDLSNLHDLAHLVGDAVIKNKLIVDGDIKEKFEKQLMSAVYRYQRIQRELNLITGVLREAQITFLPLKGSVLRDYYPQPWMRTSCDIDLLVKEEQLDAAVAALTASGFETDGKRDYHDISLYHQKNHLELHFNLCEDMEDIDVLLRQVWSYAKPLSQYEYRETSAFFAYHHLAHMKYHFVNGGCGIRQFLDLFLMKQVGFYEESELMPLLESVGLETFYLAVSEMNAVWFEGAPYTERATRCEEYILRGGVYGSAENCSAAQSAAREGKWKNAWHIVFPGYAHMCNLYPELQEKKALLPICYLRRIAGKVFGKDRKRVRKKMKNIIAEDQDRICSVNELLAAMGIGNRAE